MKKVLALLLALALVLSMAACGQKNDNASANNSPESSESSGTQNTDGANNTQNSAENTENITGSTEQTSGETGNGETTVTDPNHTHTYNSSVTKKATCADAGEKTFTCACGSSYTEAIPATGHTWGLWKIAKEPTATEQGFSQRTCTVCNTKETLAVPKLTSGHQHSYTQQVSQAPTCTQPGEKTFTCSCNHSYTETIPATGHSWSDWKTTKEPTVSAEGEAQRTCGSCRTTESKSLPKLTSGTDQLTISRETLDKIKMEFLRLVNAERAGLELGTLTLNESLDNAASIRSNETLELFSHTRPNGEPYHTVIDPAVYDYTMLGENLCMTTHVGTGSYRPAQDKWVASDAQIEAAAAWTFTLFKNSPGHYENMITPGYKECGIGISYAVDDGIPYFYTAHLFGAR